MSPNSSYKQEIRVLYNIVLHPVKGDTHQERLESFYETQAGDYDAFRKKLLRGREKLMSDLGASSHATGIWVDMGGGTGANLEMMGDEAVKKFKKIYIVDLSTSLLKVAAERAKAKGWDHVVAVPGDATTWAPAEGKADLVTFSYSISMIPDWFKAIQHAQSLLTKPGSAANGFLGVVDFYISRKYPDEGMKFHPWFQRNFWRLWFANDNVNLNPDHVPYIQSRFATETLREETAPVPYIGLIMPEVPIYSFIGQAK